MSFCSRGLRLKSQTCWPRIFAPSGSARWTSLALPIFLSGWTIWRVGASPQLLTGSYSAPVQGSNATSEVDGGEGSIPVIGLFSGNARYWVMSRRSCPAPAHHSKRSFCRPASNSPIGCTGTTSRPSPSRVQGCWLRLNLIFRASAAAQRRAARRCRQRSIFNERWPLRLPPVRAWRRAGRRPRSQAPRQ